jgi:hypothetical protein
MLNGLGEYGFAPIDIGFSVRLDPWKATTNANDPEIEMNVSDHSHHRWLSRESVWDTGSPGSLRPCPGR